MLQLEPGVWQATHAPLRQMFEQQSLASVQAWPSLGQALQTPS
jgi:hypothetical protein